MKRLFLIIVFLYISISAVFAQNISKETISKAIDKLNCLTTENSVLESKKEWKCDCESNPNFVVIKNSIPSDLSTTLLLTEEINKIKNQNVPSASKDELIKYLSEDIFTKQTQYSKLYSFETSRNSKKTFKDWKKKLKSEISNIVLNSNTDQNQPIYENVPTETAQNMSIDGQVLPPLLEEPVPTENKSESILKNSIFTFEIDVISIILMIAIAFVIVYLTKKKSASIPSESKKELSKSITNHIEQEISKAIFSKIGNMHVGNTSNEISRLKEEIVQLKKDLDVLNTKLQIENNPLEVYNQPIEDKVPEIKPPTIENKATNEIVFLSFPNSEGSFNESSSSIVYKEGASIYKFIKTNPKEANFQIDDRESSIKMAMQFPERSILPVCEPENEYEPKYSKVRTIELGKVNLEGGKWNVKRKAKIRYES